MNEEYDEAKKQITRFHKDPTLDCQPGPDTHFHKEPLTPDSTCHDTSIIGQHHIWLAVHQQSLPCPISHPSFTNQITFLSRSSPGNLLSI